MAGVLTHRIGRTPVITGNPYGLVAAGAGDQRTSSTSLAIPYPAGILANDILIAFINGSLASGTETVTTPGGWTAVNTGADNGAGKAFAFWTRATGSESGSMTFVHNGSVTNDHWSGIMAAYGGCVTGSSPIVDPQNGTGSANNMSYASVVLSAANQIKVDFGIGNGSGTTLSTPTGFSVDASYVGGTRTVLKVSEKTFVSSGASGAESATQSSSTFWSTISFGLLAA